MLLAFHFSTDFFLLKFDSFHGKRTSDYESEGFFPINANAFFLFACFWHSDVTSFRRDNPKIVGNVPCDVTNDTFVRPHLLGLTSYFDQLLGPRSIRV